MFSPKLRDLYDLILQNMMNWQSSDYPNYSILLVIQVLLAVPNIQSWIGSMFETNAFVVSADISTVKKECVWQKVLRKDLTKTYY